MRIGQVQGIGHGLYRAVSHDGVPHESLRPFAGLSLHLGHYLRGVYVPRLCLKAGEIGQGEHLRFPNFKRLNPFDQLPVGLLKRVFHQIVKPHRSRPANREILGFRIHVIPRPPAAYPVALA